MENLKHFKNLKTSKKSKISKVKNKKVENTKKTLINDSSQEINGSCSCQNSYINNLHNKRKNAKPKVPKHKDIFKE
tara:strand:+ start:1177 stop:1404 length:228 start_codon:yes stop_codon:yes gene_type:complete